MLVYIHSLYIFFILSYKYTFPKSIFLTAGLFQTSGNADI